MTYLAGGHALQDMCLRRLVSLFFCSTFVVDVNSGHFLLLNVVLGLSV